MAEGDKGRTENRADDCVGRANRRAERPPTAAPSLAGMNPPMPIPVPLCHFRRRGAALACVTAIVSLALILGCQTESAAPNRPLPVRTVQAAAPETIAFQPDFRSGLAKAQKENRPALLFFTFEGCGYCQQMKRDVLAHPEVVRQAGQFVCIEVDLDREPAVCKSLGIRGYPTILFATPQGDMLQRLTGLKAVDVVLNEMDAALRIAARGHVRSARGELKVR